LFGSQRPLAHSARFQSTKSKKYNNNNKKLKKKLERKKASKSRPSEPAAKV
jgi:hypothetical protein